MVLFNLLTLIPLLVSLNLSELKTVSDSDLKSAEVVESVDDEKLLNDEIEFNNYDFVLPIKSVSYGYTNNNYIGYNYYTITTSSDITFTFLCDGYTYVSVGYVSSQDIYRFLFGSDNGGKTLKIDFNGRILTYTLDSQGRLYANKSDFTISGSNITFTIIDSGIVTGSSGGDDPLPDDPDDPDSPIVSGGDYADILTSIDEKLTYFQELFYYGDNLDSMGDGFKILIILTFLVAINLVIKIINWR